MISRKKLETRLVALYARRSDAAALLDADARTLNEALQFFKESLRRLKSLSADINDAEEKLRKCPRQ